MPELIRKSPALLRILETIDTQWSGSEFYGSVISKETGLLPGTVYPILDRMKETGLLIDRRQQVKGAPPRRYYKLSEAGLLYMDAMRPQIKRQAECLDSLPVLPWPTGKRSPVRGLRMTTTVLTVCKEIRQYGKQRFYCRPVAEGSGVGNGSVNAVLRRMASKGLLECEPEPESELSQRDIARPMRRYYTVTPKGAVFLEGIAEHFSPQSPQ